MSKTGTRPTANLCTPGTNVVRDGKVIDGNSTDPAVLGARQFFDKLATESRVSATALQTGTLGNDQKGNANRSILDYAKATLEDGTVVSTPFWRIESGRPAAARERRRQVGTDVLPRFSIARA